jgi:hypothetical protein
MGESARLVVTLDRRLFRICIELLTLNRQWISGITRLASNCERAAHCGQHRQAARPAKSHLSRAGREDFVGSLSDRNCIIGDRAGPESCKVAGRVADHLDY